MSADTNDSNQPDQWITRHKHSRSRYDGAAVREPSIRRPRITARQGLSDHFPGNTLLAFQKALEHGADRIELDLQFSLDNQVIVHHHYSLGETDNGDGFVFQRPSSYLRDLDAGEWMSPEFAGAQIPLLDEVFGAIGGRTEYELDLKGFDLSFLQAVLDLIRAHDLAKQVELTSAFPFMLIHARRLEPRVRIGMFAHYLLADWMPLELRQTIVRENARLGDVDVVHCPLDLLTEPFIASLHADGRSVHAANCNTRDDLERALAFDIDQLSTDHVDLVVSLRG